MKKVLLYTGIPCNGGYVGGIANIINNYLINKNVFEKNGIVIDLFNYEEISPICKNRYINNILGKPLKSIYSLKQYKYDILHIHTSRKNSLLRDLFIVSQLKNKKGEIYLSIHFANINDILPKNKLTRKWCIHILSKYVDKCILLSKKTKSQFELIPCLKNKCELLYTFHSETINKNDIKRKISRIKDKEIIDILFVGSIDKRKGILDLLEACKNLKNKKYKLHICGKLTELSIKDDFNKYIADLYDNVIVHGYVSGEEKKKIFMDADILVLPSYSEGMPVVIMEAMAYGQALVVTPVGGIPEILNSDNGFFIEPGSPSQIKDAIEALMADRDKTEKIMYNNANESEKYTVYNNIENLCRIYKKEG